MAERVAERLEKGSQTARTVTTKVRYPDFSIRSRSTTLPVATDDGGRIAELACRDLAGGMILLLHDSARYADRASAEPTAEALPRIVARTAELGLELGPIGGFEPAG